MIWARMLAYITGTVDQELLLRRRARGTEVLARETGERYRCVTASSGRGLKGHGCSTIAAPVTAA